MQFKPTFLALLAAISVNAVVVDLFSDGNCQNHAGSRNVFDNSCAPLGGFSSFRITTRGGGDQLLSAYSRNACAGPVTACVDVSNVGSVLSCDE
ncbi:hypothetical protein NMY22_g16794 [Coprinellus aureogranulatus]|nr:hypothetical protein NMY22_g16794 [Coprinellus aureogranulatus]